MKGSNFKNTVQGPRRVERHLISPKHKFYKDMLDLLHKSKNLYNQANYILRQDYFETQKIYKDLESSGIFEGLSKKEIKQIKNDNLVWTSYGEMDKKLKSLEEFNDYRNIGHSHLAQQTLKNLYSEWDSFFGALKSDKIKNPQIPGFKDKDGYYVVTFTNQSFRVRDNAITLAKIKGSNLSNYSFKTRCVELSNFQSIQQIRFKKAHQFIYLDVVYSILPPKKILSDRVYSIDVGLNNLAAVTNNFYSQPFLVDGKGLKSKNSFYNKIIGEYKSKVERCNRVKTSKRIKSLWDKRDRAMNDYLHKASKLIINHAIKDNVSTIIAGWNKEMKQGNEKNKNFVQAPISKFINMLKYKCEDAGIEFIQVEESYTSGTSFLDGELPIKQFYNPDRRMKRGLFISNSGRKINADINASFQIMKKSRVSLNVNDNRVTGLVLNPFRLFVK